MRIMYTHRPEAPTVKCYRCDRLGWIMYNLSAITTATATVYLP